MAVVAVVAVTSCGSEDRAETSTDFTVVSSSESDAESDVGSDSLSGTAGSDAASAEAPAEGVSDVRVALTDCNSPLSPGVVVAVGDVYNDGESARSVVVELPVVDPDGQEFVVSSGAVTVGPGEFEWFGTDGFPWESTCGVPTVRVVDVSATSTAGAGSVSDPEVEALLNDRIADPDGFCDAMSQVLNLRRESPPEAGGSTHFHDFVNDSVWCFFEGSSDPVVFHTIEEFTTFYEDLSPASAYVPVPSDYGLAAEFTYPSELARFESNGEIAVHFVAADSSFVRDVVDTLMRFFSGVE